MREHSRTYTPPPKDSRTPGLTLPGLNHTTHSVLRGQNKTHVNRLNAMTTTFQLHKYQGLGEKRTHVEISSSQRNGEGTRQKGSQESKQSKSLSDPDGNGVVSNFGSPSQVPSTILEADPSDGAPRRSNHICFPDKKHLDGVCLQM